MTHIYWFAYFNLDEPSVRYRALYALQAIKKEHGISYSIVYPGYRPGKILRFIRQYCAVLFFRKKSSLIVYEKLHTARVYVTLLKLLLWLRPENTLYDIDDADYIKFKPDTIYHFMRNCTRCSAGSATLMAHAQQFNPNTFLLGSPVIDHRHLKTTRNQCLTIGWIGYYNAHRESLLQLFFPALKRLNIPVKLVLLGVKRAEHIDEVKAYFKTSSHLTIEMPTNINWQDEDAVYKQIATFDIGVAPLLDTEINRAKSAFKMKQYLSCGVPVLGSTVGENATLLQHGLNGFACNGPEDYEQHIKHIAGLTETEYATLCTHAKISSATFSMRAYCDTLLDMVAEDKQQYATAPYHQLSVPYDTGSRTRTLKL